MMTNSAPGNPWDQRYSGEAFFYGTEPNDFLRGQRGRVPRGAAVLFLAEGEGRNAVWFAGQDPSAKVVAVDGSSVGLAKARALAAERGVRIETQVGDLASWDPGEERWDAIVSIWAHTPPTVRAALHARCVRALRPGGVLILEAYHPRQLEFKTGGPPDAALMMTIAGLRRELAGMEFIHAAELDREIHEGKGHNGMSAVTQLVAVRPR